MEGNKKAFIPRLKKMSLPVENKYEIRDVIPDIVRRTDSGLTTLQKENTYLKKV
jgi:hypothetical protein